MRKLSALAACSAKSTRPDGACRADARCGPCRSAPSALDGGEVELLDVERVALQREARIELAGRECWAAEARRRATSRAGRRREARRTGSGRRRAASPLADAGSQDCQSEPSPITSRRSSRSLSRLSSIRRRSPPWRRKSPRNLVPLSSPAASARLSSPSPMLALAVKVKSPIEACPDMSRSPAAQRVSGRKPEPSTLTGPANTGPNSPRVSRPDVSMLFLPGSTALRRSIVSAPSLAASARSTAPTRSPPRPACSMATCSVPSPNSAASPSTSSANI